MRATIAILLLVLAGCVTSPTNRTDLERARGSVSFSVVRSPDLKGYQKHWTAGARSAWFNPSKREVLVTDDRSKQALRISNFPDDFGRIIVATGWERDQRFFVHLSDGADSGTMLYCDLSRKEVSEVKHWGGF